MSALTEERHTLAQLDHTMVLMDKEIDRLRGAMPRASRLLIIARGALSEALAEIKGEEQ